jgi:hypothetical protein
LKEQRLCAARQDMLATKEEIEARTRAENQEQEKRETEAKARALANKEILLSQIKVGEILIWKTYFTPVHTPFWLLMFSYNLLDACTFWQTGEGDAERQ